MTGQAREPEKEATMSEGAFQRETRDLCQILLILDDENAMRHAAALEA